MAESYPTPEAPAQKKSNKTLIIIIVVVLILLLLCCCVIVFVGPLILNLLGSQVGGVFSNIIEQMTPVP